MPSKTPCPRCYVDYVMLLWLSNINQIVSWCPECSATWPLGTAIKQTTFQEFRQFVNQYGFKPDSSFMRVIKLDDIE